MTQTQPVTDVTPARANLLPVLKGVAALFAALVLLQAFLAGRGWFVDMDLIDVHRTMGEVTFLVAVVQIALAGVVFGSSGLRHQVTLISALLLVLTAVQLALGFATEDSATAAAWHIPNGVLIFGLATVNSATVFRLRRAPS